MKFVIERWKKSQIVINTRDASNTSSSGRIMDKNTIPGSLLPKFQYWTLWWGTIIGTLECYNIAKTVMTWQNSQVIIYISFLFFFI